MMRWGELVDMVARDCQRVYGFPAQWHIDGRAVFTSVILDLKPVVWNEAGSGVITYEQWAEVRAADLPRIPTHGDEFEVNGVRYRVVEVYREPAAVKMRVVVVG